MLNIENEIITNEETRKFIDAFKGVKKAEIQVGKRLSDKDFMPYILCGFQNPTLNQIVHPLTANLYCINDECGFSKKFIDFDNVYNIYQEMNEDYIQIDFTEYNRKNRIDYRILLTK